VSRSLEVRVVEVVDETADACSFVLEPIDADTRLDYRPGQFVTVRIPTVRADGDTPGAERGGVARCYSLSSSPLLDEKPKITVKRVAEGLGSNWLCDEVVAGSTLEVLRPAGTFTPRSLDEDLLLVAGGSGITPVLSILRSALHAGEARVTLVYANRDEDAVIFADELSNLSRQFPDRLVVVHWLESLQGLPTVAQLHALLAPFADRAAYVCGPGPFMDATTDALEAAGAPRGRIHVERFHSLTTDPFSDETVELATDGPAGEVVVELDGQTHQLRWPEGTLLLDVLLDAGLDAPYSCREGNCSACACILKAGEIAMDHNEVLEEEDLAEGFILGCQARAVSDRVEVTYDE
jgi:3-ketosteroid 9alpha-monooxygenase subunit B